jgi:hypothetical protein
VRCWQPPHSDQAPLPRRCKTIQKDRLRLDHLDDSHPAEVFVVEDVAVVHRLGVIPERHSDSDPSACGNQHNIPPGAVWSAIRSDYLKGVCMEVERMVHGGWIDQVPVFDGTESNPRIDSTRVERAAVDCEPATEHAHTQTERE